MTSHFADIAAGLFGTSETQGANASTTKKAKPASTTKKAKLGSILATPETQGANAPPQDIPPQFKDLFAAPAPAIRVHPPLPPDDGDPYRPTAKTGVALGLLRLCPGEQTALKTHEKFRSAQDTDAPFHFYVGRLRHGKFQPVLSRNEPYHVWKEIGGVGDRVFNLFYTQLPQAANGEMHEGDRNLKKRRIQFAGECKGKKVFARVTGPRTLEVCVAASSPTPKDAAKPESAPQTLELD
jgi:hypothetical protein